jgi:hypothetical protein
MHLIKPIFVALFFRFIDNPYPNRKQKQELATATGMTLKQIVHWMSNIRKRRFMPLLR